MKPARENHERLAGVADAVTVAAVDMAVAAKVASEEATDEFANHGSCRRDWAGLDSNQRRRKASRFTVCPVWPLRNLPVGANLIYLALCAPQLIWPPRVRTTRKTPQSNLPHSAALRAKSLDRSGVRVSRARRFPSPGNGPACNRGKQKIFARASQADNRSLSRSHVWRGAHAKHRVLGLGQRIDDKCDDSLDHDRDTVRLVRQPFPLDLRARIRPCKNPQRHVAPRTSSSNEEV